MFLQLWLIYGLFIVSTLQEVSLQRPNVFSFIHYLCQLNPVTYFIHSSILYTLYFAKTLEYDNTYIFDRTNILYQCLDKKVRS